VEVRSPSFTVVSDGSEKDARKVVLQFEQVRALLQEVWPWARVDTLRPLTILAARDEGALRRLLPVFWEKEGAFHPAGLFVRAPDRGWVALRTDVARFREGDETWDNPYLVVFHEYVHLVLGLNFESLPVWLNEGLAEFWGNTMLDGDRVYEGRPVPYHLLTLRQRSPMSLAALFAVEHGSPEYSEENRATVFYAQSWALVHYLVLGSDERQGQINRFATLIHSGRPPDDAAPEAFGDLKALEGELQSYVRRPVFRYRRRPARVEVKAEAWTARVLPDADSLALRGQFHAAMGRGTEARTLAGQALALDPGSAAAHEALALLAWREGKRAEARDSLARATSLPGASDYAHYLYGQLLWDSLDGTEGLDRVEASFRRATELNPSFADARENLARVQALLRELAEPPPSREVRVPTTAGDAGDGTSRPGGTRLAPVEGGAPSAAPGVTVAFEFVVEDARGRPVTDLRLEEIEVVQDATRQKVRTFGAQSRPGRYELTYTPLSGKAGAVTLWVTRRGAIARGPDGRGLKPRVISALPPLEAELTGVLDARAEAADLACRVAVLRFEPVARGLRHAVAVEIPLSVLRFEGSPPGGRARLQVLARVRSIAEPEARQHVTLDRVVEVTSDAAIRAQTLLWTGTVVIGPGRHVIDVLVRDPGADRVTSRTLSVEVPPAAEGLHMSSVALLRPRGFFFLRDDVEGDDPLVYRGEPLMPTLEPTVAVAEEPNLRFYVALYPAAGSGEPVTLKAEVLRDGAKVGEAPIRLPQEESSGQIRYVGFLVLRPLRAGSYVLRLVASQGGASVADEAAFVLR
jgi:tetratricopeptide (TPR) repeat protein